MAGCLSCRSTAEPCNWLQIGRPETAGPKFLRYTTYGSIIDEAKREMFLIGRRACDDEIHLTRLRWPSRGFRGRYSPGMPGEARRLFLYRCEAIGEASAKRPGAGCHANNRNSPLALSIRRPSRASPYAPAASIQHHLAVVKPKESRLFP